MIGRSLALLPLLLIFAGMTPARGERSFGSVSLHSGYVVLKETIADRRYEGFFMGGLRGTLDLNRPAEPFLGVQYGETSNDEGRLLRVVNVELGVRIDVAHISDLHLYGGFAMRTNAINEWVPAYNGRRRNSVFRAGAQLFLGPEWRIASNRGAIGLELAYALDGDARDTTGISGYEFRGYVALDP